MSLEQILRCSTDWFPIFNISTRRRNIIIENTAEYSVINLLVLGRERYSAHPPHPPGWSPHHGAGHPLRLQLGVQAAGDGEEHQQD